MPKRRTLFFFAVIFAAFILMTIQSRRGRFSSPSLPGEPLNASHAAARSLADSIMRPFRMIALRDEENRELRKRVDGLLLERERFQEVLLENRRLRELLAFRDTQRSVVAAARIIARGMDNWTHTVVIDKGGRDGIAKDMAAVSPKGLVGKVISVSDGYATLLLVTDVNFSAAVRLEGTRKEAVLSGTGSGRCLLKYMPYEDEVKTGDVVVTSGLDSLFPAGIPVGYASRVDSSGRGGNFQFVEVTPFQDNTRLEEVLVVR